MESAQMAMEKAKEEGGKGQNKVRTFFCVCLFIKAKVADDAVPGVELVSVVGSSLLAVLGRCLLFVLRRVYVGQARESAGP